MVTPRRSAAVLLAILIFLAWFAWFRPAALGGPATFIMISGDSMEPTYSHGDFVVLRETSTYKAGDIVAYPMETYFESGRLVIHRITGEDQDGFITQGDNRDSADPWRPADEDIRGSAWLHIPKLGIYLAWLRQPSHLGGLASGIFLLGGIGTAETQRRRRHGMRGHVSARASWLRAGGAFSKYLSGLVGLSVAAAVVALAFLLLGVVAFKTASHGSREVSRPAYSETGTFDYAIVMEPSTLYPDGVLRPQPGAAAQPQDEETAASPAPAFTSLAREARVTFQYELESPEPIDLSGTIAADLVIRPERGEWSRTAPLLALEAFEGLSVSRSLSVDLLSVGSLIARIEEETGLAAGSYELVVVTHVNALGTRNGEPLETSFESTFTLNYDRTLITPPSALTTTAQATSTETVATAKSMSLGVWAPSVSTARTLAAVGFMAALGAALVSGGYLAFGLMSDEQARIRARYGSRLVDVQGPGAAQEDSIRVASMRDLARLAERCGSVILHAPLPSGHRYFVRDGEDTYEYRSPANGSGAPASGQSVADLPGSRGGTG